LPNPSRAVLTGVLLSFILVIGLFGFKEVGKSAIICNCQKQSALEFSYDLAETPVDDKFSIQNLFKLSWEVFSFSFFLFFQRIHSFIHSYRTIKMEL